MGDGDGCVRYLGKVQCSQLNHDTQISAQRQPRPVLKDTIRDMPQVTSNCFQLSPELTPKPSVVPLYFPAPLPLCARFRLPVENRYTTLDGTGHIVLVYIFAVIVLPFLGLLAQLLGFHVMLSEWDCAKTCHHAIRRSPTGEMVLPSVAAKGI